MTETDKPENPYASPEGYTTPSSPAPLIEEKKKHPIINYIVNASLIAGALFLISVRVFEKQAFPTDIRDWFLLVITILLFASYFTRLKYFWVLPGLAIAFPIGIFTILGDGPIDFAGSTILASILFSGAAIGFLFDLFFGYWKKLL